MVDVSSLAMDEWHENSELVAREMAYHPEARQTTYVEAESRVEKRREYGTLGSVTVKRQKHLRMIKGKSGVDKRTTEFRSFATREKGKAQPRRSRS